MKNFEFLPKDNAKAEDKKTENNPESLEKLLEDYFFDQQEKFSSKDLQKLARLQKKNKFNQNKWTIGDETERCNLMKKLETYLLSKDEKGREKFWKNNEYEYRDCFGISKENESKLSFEILKHGILNEIIANKILEKISDFQFKITKSEIDIYNKIDIIGYSNDNKIILAIQVKQGSRYEREKTQIAQEVNVRQKDHKDKNDFLSGCLEFKNKLKLNDKGIILMNLWITIPAREKIGEGGKYTYDLQKNVIEGIKDILEQKN